MERVRTDAAARKNEKPSGTLPEHTKREGILKYIKVSPMFDKPLLLFVLALLSMGLVVLYSSSFVYSLYEYGSTYYIIRRQFFFAILGVSFMLIVSMIDYHILIRFSVPLMVLSWILLVVVLFMKPIAFVHRWIRLPVIGQFQPSEIAKFSITLLISHIIAWRGSKMKQFWTSYVPLLLILGITCGLVVIEPHLSGTLLILGIGISLLFIGGVRPVYIIGTILIGATLAGVMIFVFGYQLDRIQVWLDPIDMYEKSRDTAWQTIQSLYAIGSGGILGQGLGNSRQKHLFLPEGHNDFIFAVLCEELGLVGAAIVIGLFMLVVWRGVLVGMRAPDKFGSLLAIGLTIQIGLQAFFNIAVVTNTLPNTGISLPFFSYGGTSLLMLLAQVGVVLSVSRQSRQGS